MNSDRSDDDAPSVLDFLDAPRIRRELSIVEIDGVAEDLNATNSPLGRDFRQGSTDSRLGASGASGYMSKSEFVERVAAEANLSKSEAVAAVDAVLSTIEDELKCGGEVNLVGFGKFHVSEQGARQGRNPQTGESMHIAARKVPRFSAGSGLKNALK